MVFQKAVWKYYKEHGRSMPWRNDTSPYAVFVSEIMLQQTQVSRVIEKYTEFVTVFPDFASLARASTQKLLSVWQGLGYNRRALYLRRAAQMIMDEYVGRLPGTVELLDALPGIGYATACSIAAFAFNAPVVFIETNIRRVYIHHYFKERYEVTDAELLPIVETTLDRKRPREWYWALMDYGAYLVKQEANPNTRSAHYVKQKKFEGSIRQVRGELLRLLLEKPQSHTNLKKKYKEDTRLDKALEGLLKDKLIKRTRNVFCLQ